LARSLDQSQNTKSQKKFSLLHPILLARSFVAKITCWGRILFSFPSISYSFTLPLHLLLLLLLANLNGSNRGLAQISKYPLFHLRNSFLSSVFVIVLISFNFSIHILLSVINFGFFGKNRLSQSSCFS
jgi:hypothetical protein